MRQINRGIEQQMPDRGLPPNHVGDNDHSRCTIPRRRKPRWSGPDSVRGRPVHRTASAPNDPAHRAGNRHRKRTPNDRPRPVAAMLRIHPPMPLFIEQAVGRMTLSLAKCQVVFKRSAGSSHRQRTRPLPDSVRKYQSASNTAHGTWPFPRAASAPPCAGRSSGHITRGQLHTSFHVHNIRSRQCIDLGFGVTKLRQDFGCHAR